MRTSAPAVRTQGTRARVRALGPLMERLHERFAERPAGRLERAVEIEIEGVRVVVGPWEQELFRRCAPGAGEEAVDWWRVVTQGVALRVKGLVDLARLEQIKERDARLFALQAELMLDTAIGMALVGETHRFIGSLLQRGELEDARRLTRFHHGLRSIVVAVKRSLAESERARAVELVDCLTDAEIVPSRPEAAGDEEEETPPAPRTRAIARWQRLKIRRRPRDSTSDPTPVPLLAPRLPKTQVLAGALALTLALWQGLTRLPLYLASPPPPLTRASLDAGEVVESVEARPPSLFVDVDTRSWEAMTDATRRELILQVSTVLKAHGYTGALFETVDGRAVGRWFTGRGPEIIGNREEARRTF